MSSWNKMKPRPESRQKDAGNDDEPSTQSEKQQLQKHVDLMSGGVLPSKSVGKVVSAIRVKSAKSGKSITRMIRAENTKNQVLKKFKGSRGNAKLESKEEEKPNQNKNMPIWDEKLEKLSISRKTSEMIDKEIGWRYIRITPATPSLLQVQVKRQRPKGEINRKTFGVIRPASFNALPIPTDLLGPRYNKQGQIVAHSILGDVDEFIQRACIHQRKKSSIVCEVQDAKPDPGGDERSVGIYDPHVNESKALNTWNAEMQYRKHTQKQLADMLDRPVGDLLMYKSDSYNEKGERIRFIQHFEPEYHPDVCFWRLPDRVCDNQLLETLTRSYRGYLPSPVISGHANSMLKQKGKIKDEMTVSGWAANEYSHNRIQETQGVIKISNNVLFAELELHGVSLQSKQTQKKVNEKGDSKDGSKGVHFLFEKGPAGEDQTEQLKQDDLKHHSSCKILPDSGTDKIVHKSSKDISVKVDVPALLIDGTLVQWRSLLSGGSHDNENQLHDDRNHDSGTQVNGSSSHDNGNLVDDNSSHGNGKQLQDDGSHDNGNLVDDNSSHGNGKQLHDTGSHDNGKQVNGSSSHDNGNLVDDNSSHGNGKQLHDDGSHDNGNLVDDNSNHGNRIHFDNNISKEVFVAINANVKEVVQGFAKITNCGNTVLRYYWMKVPAHRPLPVPRPKRRYFYFLDNDGVILPDETLYVPMLFRSRTPGYFTESWLLSTIPPLEGGAKVKFTFKGIAVHMPDFSPHAKKIEDYLLRNQIQTLCSTAVQSSIDHAIMEASLKEGQLNDEELDPPTAETSFMQENPRLYYHANIVRNLHKLEESLNIDETDVPISTYDSTSPVSVMKLFEMIHVLPDGNGDESCSSSETSQTSDSNKELLLWQLNRDISALGFSPFCRIESKLQYEYAMMYTMLQNSVDQFVRYAWTMADVFKMIQKDDVKDQENEPKKSSKNKAKKTNPKGGKKSTDSPELQTAVSTVAISPDNKVILPVFSNAHKYRQENVGKFDPKLSHYDEKVYLEMYSILSVTIDQITEIFAEI